MCRMYYVTRIRPPWQSVISGSGPDRKWKSWICRLSFFCTLNTTFGFCLTGWFLWRSLHRFSKEKALEFLVQEFLHIYQMPFLPTVSKHWRHIFRHFDWNLRMIAIMTVKLAENVHPTVALWHQSLLRHFLSPASWAESSINLSDLRGHPVNYVCAVGVEFTIIGWPAFPQVSLRVCVFQC